MDVKEKKTGRPVINTPDTRRRKRRELESVRKKCSVHIGAEIERWNALRVEYKLKTHQELAALLLDRYEESRAQDTIPSADNITYSTPGPSKKPRLQPPDESDILEEESTVLRVNLNMPYYEKNRAQDTIPSTDNITYSTPGPSKKSRWKLPEVLDISEAELRGVRATCIPHPVRGMEISKHRNQLGKERLPYLPQHTSNHVTCIQHPEIAMATSSEKLKHRNRLAMERSPYLLQHATNPVDWYPWGQEAFDRAKAENKLIFLSVGYSTCHWCHVMERESFENAEIGKILNENFVSIKVDREERPDVDRVYMTFIQATSGDSGWPMSVWLTPDLKPLYGGTYFPTNDQHFDRPGLKSVLMNIAHQWKTKQAVIEEQTVKILNTLKKGTSMSEAPGQSIPDKQCVQLLFSMLDESFDSELGGFGKAPKFPQPVNFNFLFRMYSLDQESSEGKQALFMALFTLKMMANGGIFDHVAKGFHRYSTDKHWHVPHFEKMLYDQGQLLFSFAEAHQITKDKMFETVARDIVEYVSRDLSHISGGFYSAEDADSFPTEDSAEKKEGAFCVWTHAEIQEYLSEKVNDKLSLADIFCFHFNVKQDGNVDPYQDPHEELKKQNVLIVKGSSEETAKHFNMSVDDVKSSLEKCQQILYEVRLKRPKPHLDNKMIASWNGLMISGLAKTGQVLNDPKITQRAVDGATFLRTHMYSKEKQIMYRTSYVDDDGQGLHGSPEIEGFIDDYAFVIRGLLDLYEATFEDKWLKWAEELQVKQNELFLDRENGGYYSNSGKDASIIMKLKDDQDWAEPCVNSVAVNNLLRLSNFLNRPDWYNMSAQITKLFYERLTKVPIAVPEMVCGLMSIHTPLKQIVIVGEKDSKELNLFLECVNSVFFPNKIVILFDKSSNSFLSEKLEFLNSLTKIDGKTTAYVCENYACSLPVNTISDLKKLLQKARKSNM